MRMESSLVMVLGILSGLVVGRLFEDKKFVLVDCLRVCSKRENSDSWERVGREKRREDDGGCWGVFMSFPRHSWGSVIAGMIHAIHPGWQWQWLWKVVVIWHHLVKNILGMRVIHFDMCQRLEVSSEFALIPLDLFTSQHLLDMFPTPYTTLF